VKSLLRLRPSPAMIVALIALFVAMGGVSYGFATGTIDTREIKDNDVRSRDIRNNEIRTRDLRNNEVRGLDIRNSTIQSRDIALNAVTGADVKEDTLGKVPSAALADSATSASSVSTLKTIPVTTVAERADPVVLATHGPLTLTGECATGAVGRLFVSTTENNSAAAAAGTGADVSQPDLDSSAPPFMLGELGGMPTPAYGVRSISAFAPSGKGFAGDVALFRDAVAGRCRFHGSLSLQG
jgi:hypothetical protein